MTATPSPSRREDPRMHTVEMASVAEQLAAEGWTPPRPSTPLPPRTVAGLVAAGGALGALARFAAETIVPSTFTPTLVEIPWATWTVNLLGCLGIGVLTGVLEVRPRAPRWCQPLIGTGFCGGFTTMSSLVLQISAMIGSDFPLVALEYGIATAAVAVAGAVAGIAAGRVLGRRGRA